MRHKPYAIVVTIALALMASAGGCAANKPPPATQPMALDVPIVYSSYFGPQRLNDAQRREIKAVISEAKAGEPWFVYVRYSRGGTYRVSAYSRPTAKQGFARRGKVVFVDNDISLNERRQIVRQLGAEWPAPQPYLQLSTRPSDQMLTPAEVDLPFSPPDGISDGELIKVVDAARTAATKNDSTAADMPVCNIEVGKDGTVRVFFGWQAGGLNGRGVFVELKREGAGFAEPSVGMWVS
jgi:hypothetical protein